MFWCREDSVTAVFGARGRWLRRLVWGYSEMYQSAPDPSVLKSPREFFIHRGPRGGAGDCWAHAQPRRETRGAEEGSLRVMLPLTPSPSPLPGARGASCDLQWDKTHKMLPSPPTGALVSTHHPNSREGRSSAICFSFDNGICSRVANVDNKMCTPASSAGAV